MTSGDVVDWPSPNQGARRNGLTPTLIVIHYTAMTDASAALDRLCDPNAEVSAHYLIGGDGTVFALVAEDRRAWHAGAGTWAGQGDVNSRSIGIELDNRGDHPFSERQMTALERLIAGIMARWEIAPEGVIGHSDFAPERKDDPGPRFDWARLARQGLAGHATGAAAPAKFDAAAYTKAAIAAGYPGDVPFDCLLKATRLRFAPWRSGPLCAADMCLHHGLRG